MSRKRRSKSFDKMVRFLTTKHRIQYNSDDSSVNLECYRTKSYERGTYYLNKKENKLGGLACLEVGYERRKLD